MALPTSVHHPPEEHLMHHAAGQLDATRRVLIEAHLRYCISCSESLATFAAPGRHWLEDQPVVAAKPSIWASLQDRIDAEGAGDGDPLLASLPLPLGARGELPNRAKPVRWRRIPLSNARYGHLHRDPHSGGRLVAVRIGGGRTFPKHTHLGTEEIVVLSGAFSDQQGHFGVGDYQVNAGGTQHAPEVDAGEPCWIVARYQRGIEFVGLRKLLVAMAR